MIRTATVICAAVILASCAVDPLKTYVDRPVIEDQLSQDRTDRNEIGTLAVTAQRRVVVTNLRTGHFCSEPPPEAADAIATALAAAIKANIDPDKSVGAEFSGSFNSQVRQLYLRSHVVQMFRDTAYYMCLDAINNAMDTENYPKMRKKNTKTYRQYASYDTEMLNILRSDFIPALKEEIKAYYDVEKERAKHAPVPSQDVILCNTTAEVDNTSDGEDKKLSANVTCQPVAKVAAPAQ